MRPHDLARRPRLQVSMPELRGREGCVSKELSMSRCELVEVTSVADAIGDHCVRIGTGQCSDCGTPICEVHTATCEMCEEVFCRPCLSFHKAHVSPPKPIAARRHTERKSA